MATIAPHSERTVISDVCWGKDNSVVVTISAVSEKGYTRKIKLIAASISTSADDQRFNDVDYFAFEVKAKQQEVVVINDHVNRTHLIGVYWDGTEGGLQTAVCLDKQLRPIKGRFACTPHNITTNNDAYRYGLCVKIGETHYTNCQAVLMPLSGLDSKYRYVEGKILCEYLLWRKTAKDVQKAAQKGEARRDELAELRKQVLSLTEQLTKSQKDLEYEKSESDNFEADLEALRVQHNELIQENKNLREKIQETETWNTTFQRRLAIGDARRDKIEKILRKIQPRRFMPTLRLLHVLNTVQSGLNMIHDIHNGKFDDEGNIPLLDREVI